MINNEMYKQYNQEVKKLLQDKYKYANTMQVPTITKIVVNAGVGKEFRDNTSVIDEMSEILAAITGQKPVVINAKNSISNFRLREGTPNGLKVTLRRERMWDFLQKLILVALPRIKDFRGVKKTAFDKRGNYSLGIKEHTIFPEIDSSKFSKIRSLQVVITTNSGRDDVTYDMLSFLNFPFQKSRK